LFKKFTIGVAAEVQTNTAGASAISALWTLPSIIGAALFVGLAAEAAQFLNSQGRALRILARLQWLRVFAVAAAMTWEAGKDPKKVHRLTANFTRCLHLLIDRTRTRVRNTSHSLFWQAA